MNNKKYGNVVTLKKALEQAEKGRYAIGSFSPRYTDMIRAILRAGEKMKSPLIIQVSQKEFDRYGTQPSDYGKEFFQAIEDENITVPVVLHLDHTKDFEVIKDAIDAGFTSVMIDASDLPFEENINISSKVAKYAHSKGVSVEAELGLIGTTDFIETDKDEELYTDPKEACEFVERTNIDALAVSIGTAHGVYNVRKPKVDINRLSAIRNETPVHLVLHGGSGVPAKMIQAGIKIPNGGISKVNVATDLEIALLKSLDREKPMSNDVFKALSEIEKRLGQDTVEKVVMDKINNFVLSNNKVESFEY